jgi:predicted TIM-barrel fold metal-dependent hydrolase
VPLWNLDERFRIMDKYENLVQVLTLGWPPVEEVAEGQTAVDLAKRANDEMAELVRRYPDRFIAAIACLPMNNMDAALVEVDRAVRELSFRGVLVYTPTCDKPLDSPEFMPLYEKMAHYDLPVFIHPMRSADYPDYRTENASKYHAYSTFGWPYETTMAMTRLVFGGVLERYPNLKVVTHHCGGMIPYFDQRITVFHDVFERQGQGYRIGLTRAPIDYYKMFYADTALYGNSSALMCARAFFGTGHLLFGADMPLGDSQVGHRNYRQTINAIETMDIREDEKTCLFEDNARKLMRLPI